MKAKQKKVLMILLLLVFFGSAAMLLYQTWQYRQADVINQEAENLVSIPDLPQLSEPIPEKTDGSVPVDPYAASLKNLDLAALQALNSEVQAWIIIPNSEISYPLVQGMDNSYYLKHSYKKTASASGSIFLDTRNQADLTDFNSIVYGHRMKNGTMFESLKHYKDYSYWEEHPYVYITRAEGSYQYTIFASYEDSVHGQSYQTNFEGSQSAKQSFLDKAVGSSWIKTNVSVNAKDRVLTLSTCTGKGYDKRLVVHAKFTSFTPAD